MPFNLRLRSEKLQWKQCEMQLSIVHLSDFHLYTNTNAIDEIEDAVSGLRADVICLTGDYIDRLKCLESFINFVERLTKASPVYFTLGNHDKRFETKLRFRLSEIDDCHDVDAKAHRFLTQSKEKLHITLWNGRHQASPTENEGHLVLLHNPRSINKKDLDRIDLVLAGHLHGGQFVFHEFKNGKLFPGCLFYPYCADATVIEGTTIIVSRGLGDIFPFRFNCPHEVVHIQVNQNNTPTTSS